MPPSAPALTQPERSSSLRFGVLIGLLIGLVPSLEAKPDFTASEITVASKMVLEGEVAHFKLWLRNHGDEAADPTQVRIQWPLMGHLVEVRGLENAKTDHDAREVTASGSLPVGSQTGQFGESRESFFPIKSNFQGLRCSHSMHRLFVCQKHSSPDRSLSIMASHRPAVELPGHHSRPGGGLLRGPGWQ